MIDDPNRGSGRLLPKMPPPPHVKRPSGDGYMPPLDAIKAEINVRLQLASKADDHRIAAGKLLIEARERVEAGEAGVDLLRKSGEFPVSNEELNDTATTVYEGI